jgi:integrase/recombinase XerD
VCGNRLRQQKRRLPRLPAKRCGQRPPDLAPPISFTPPPDQIPRYLHQDEVGRFFDAIQDQRDRLLFTLVYLYGLRVGEVALIHRGDVDLLRGTVVVRRLKGGLWSERPLFEAARDLLRRYLCRVPGQSGDPLFLGREGPLRKRQIQELFTRYRDRAQLPNRFTCHGLRHSIATHLLDAGVSLEFVQDHLGHRSIRSTSIYARITDRRRAAVFRQLERSPWIVSPKDAGNVPAPR